MSVFLVDYENVQSATPLYGIEELEKDDLVVLFYSDCAKTIKRYYWDIFCSGRCKTWIVKLVKTSKNALDFYISVEVGRRIAFGEKEIAIISNDKGYGAVSDYVKTYLKNDSQLVVRTSSIAEAKAIFNSSENDKELLIKSLNEETKIDAKHFYSLRKVDWNDYCNPNVQTKKNDSMNNFGKIFKRFFVRK